jgi:spermidine/putrescine ABC transporter ATP-binding subunit
MTLVELKDIRASYGDTEVLKGVSLTFQPGEFVAILGPSGCGKTTLLRIIAGFNEYLGCLKIGGDDVAHLPPHQRNIGIVFQDYALFPHKTVQENIAYGLKVRRLTREEVDARVSEMVALLKLDGLNNRYPHALSGGQRQRVAIARALAIKPKMLLLDEPLSALDKKLREEMQVELRQLQKSIGITTLFVTHDQGEALALADKVVVMKDGLVRQIGVPSDVYRFPSDAFVADFIGKSNFFVADSLASEGELTCCRLATGETAAVPAACAQTRNGRLMFSVRPERFQIMARATPADGMNVLDGVVEHVVFMGPSQQVRVRLAGNQIVDVQTPGDALWRIGEEVTLRWQPRDCIVVGLDERPVHKLQPLAKQEQT